MNFNVFEPFSVSNFKMYTPFAKLEVLIEKFEFSEFDFKMFCPK